MNRLILSNPLVRRYYRSLLRPSSFWIYITIYVSVVILLLFVNTISTGSLSVPYYAFARGLFVQFLVIEVVLLWVWTTYNSATVLKGEILNRTYDFFRLLPLSALQKTCGLLIGRNLLALLLAGVSLVPIIGFGLLGRVSVATEGQIVLLLLSVALFANSLVLLLSNTTSRAQTKTSSTVWLLLVVFSAPFALAALFSLVGAVSEMPEARRYSIAFYAIRAPTLLLIGLIALYFAVWNILGLVRKFTVEGEPLFGRMSALLYLLGYEIIALGLFLPHLPDHQDKAYPMWLLVSLIPAVLIPLGSIRTFDSYLERCNPFRCQDRTLRWAMLRCSNLTLATGLLVLWVAFSVIAVMVNGMSLMEFAYHAAGILSFCLVLLLLLELYVVYQPRFNQIGTLLCFLALMYSIVPLILAVATPVASLRFFSFLGFFVYLFDPSQSPGVAVKASILGVNALLCVIPALLIGHRYAGIRLLRQTMAGTQHPQSIQRAG
ncbi:MAG: hypothetical protein ABFD90_02530 [Phycisphaerales bacterium]